MRKKNSVCHRRAWLFIRSFPALQIPIWLWFQVDSCLHSVFLNGSPRLLLAVTLMEQEAQVGLLNLWLQVPGLTLLTAVCRAAAPSSPHPSASENCLEVGKVQWLLTPLSPAEAYPTQFLLSSSSKKKKWKEEWRGLNCCQGKEKGEQPGRGAASTANCWEAGFWGTGVTGKRWDRVSSKFVYEEILRKLIEQILTSEKLYLNTYVILMQIILFCLGFCWVMKKRLDTSSLRTSYHGQQS